jgi:hypothetical protein
VTEEDIPFGLAKRLEEEKVLENARQEEEEAEKRRLYKLISETNFKAHQVFKILT